MNAKKREQRRRARVRRMEQNLRQSLHVERKLVAYYAGLLTETRVDLVHTHQDLKKARQLAPPKEIRDALLDRLAHEMGRELLKDPDLRHRFMQALRYMPGTATFSVRDVLGLPFDRLAQIQVEAREDVLTHAIRYDLRTPVIGLMVPAEVFADMRRLENEA